MHATFFATVLQHAHGPHYFQGFRCARSTQYLYKNSQLDSFGHWSPSFANARQYSRTATPKTNMNCGKLWRHQLLCRTLAQNSVSNQDVGTWNVSIAQNKITKRREKEVKCLIRPLCCCLTILMKLLLQMKPKPLAWPSLLQKLPTLLANISLESDKHRRTAIHGQKGGAKALARWKLEGGTTCCDTGNHCVVVSLS